MDLELGTLDFAVLKPTLFIINPAAGHRAMVRWDRLAVGLEAEGQPFEQAVTAGPGDASRIARQAVGTFDCIVAVGGDGTVCEVLSGIMAAPPFTTGVRQEVRTGPRLHQEEGSGMTSSPPVPVGEGLGVRISSAPTQPRPPSLAIVPLGTGNDIAATAGIQACAASLQALALRQTRAVDVIQIHCRLGGEAVVRHALGFASVGITSELLRRTTPRLKRYCGQRAAYVAGILLSLVRYSAPMMKITCGGRTVQNRFIFACASNSETFGGGLKIAPGALVDDGMLNINLIEAIGRLEALRHLPKLLNGRHTNHPKVRYKTGEELTIETENPIEVAADGDLIGCTPARFQVLPRALRMLVLHSSKDFQ